MEVNLLFLLCFTLYLRAIFPGGLYLEGRFNGGFFCVTGLRGLYLEGLIHGGAYFRNFTALDIGVEKLLGLSRTSPRSYNLLAVCNGVGEMYKYK